MQSYAQAWPELPPERQALLQEGQLNLLDKLRSLFLRQTSALESVCQVQSYVLAALLCRLKTGRQVPLFQGCTLRPDSLLLQVQHSLTGLHPLHIQQPVDTQAAEARSTSTPHTHAPCQTLLPAVT